MTNRGRVLSRKLWRGAWAWACAGVMLLLLPVVAGAQTCPVPESRLNEYWQRAYEAYERDDCVNFVEYAGWYYGMVNHSTFSWNTAEIGRAVTHCKGVLYSALKERDSLRQENANLRQRLSAGPSFRSQTYGLTVEKPSLSGRPPHVLP